MENQVRDKLVEFLDTRVFDRILSQPEGAYASAEERQRLADVKQKADDAKRRYHDEYDSPHEVRRHFLIDLRSGGEESVQRDLEALRLPRLADVHDEFLQLCDRLGVRPE